MQKPKRVRRPADYILTSSTSMPSAKALRDAIERITGRHYLVTNREGVAQNCVARYGGSIMVPGLDSGLNSVERIACLGNKSSFARAISGPDKPYEVPVFHVQSNEPTEFPVLVRETLTGYGGVGIHIVHNIEEFNAIWRRGWWWVHYYQFTSEYRVHVAGGRVLRVFEKVRSEGLETEEFPIRNSDRGYHFSLVERPRFGESIRRAVESICSIPMFSQGFFALDMGGIVGSQRENRPARLIIIEGNSAPGLTENDTTADMYAGYIVDILGIERLTPTVPAEVPELLPRATVNTLRDATAQTSVERILGSISADIHNVQQRTPPTPVQPAQARPDERRTNEVLRPETHPTGTGLHGSSNPRRDEHNNSSGSTEWSW